MVEEGRDTVNLMEISTIDEEQQRQPRTTLETSQSILNFEPSNVPQSVLDVLDEIYSSRTHRKCIDISYFTLLSMTLSVILWICYWLTYNRCENLEDPETNSFLCDFAIILETLTFISLSISPFLFIFMIYLWIYYSCYNPVDSIREKFIGFKIEGDQWKQQLDYYYNEKKIKCFNCFRRKQRKELIERGYGYIIVSPHGIVIDELILFSNRKNIIDNGILSDNNKLLKLTFKKTWKRPWKMHITIYLPEDPIGQHDMEELLKLLKIQRNTDAVPSSF